MKIKQRTIDNTEWITNIIISQDDIYFLDSHFALKKSILYRISKKFFFENLINQADIGRFFLANPLPHISNNNLASRDTDVELFKTFQGYVQRYTKIEEEIWISFLKEKKIITINQKNEGQKEIQILQVEDDKILGIYEEKLGVFDKNLNKVKDINIKAVNAIWFNQKIIYQDLENNLWICENNESKLIKKCEEFISIFYLNKNNLIISYRNSNKSTLYNFEKNLELPFLDYYVYRAVLVDGETLICKPFWDKKGEANLHQKIIIIN